MSRIALAYDPWLLSARGTLDLDGYRDDPRGLSGSEMCAVRLYEEFKAAGHDVTCFWPGATPWEERTQGEFDVALSINIPGDLEGMNAKLRCCYTLLNDFTFTQPGFEQHVDLFASPSDAHLEQCLRNPDWRRVAVDWEHPEGKVQWDPESKPWAVVPLGCDPERYRAGWEWDVESATVDETGHVRSIEATPLPRKVPGRVVYCSSPDRGLHWLLQEWPAIKRAVPHATLKVFYRTAAWIETMKAQVQPDGSVYPGVFPQVQRALYIEECLRRLEGYGVELVDSVSRATLEREMAQAECLAYPCDVVNSFTEGFSCSTLEGCAARACPVIFDTDALGSIYGGACIVTPRGKLDLWRAQVIAVLTNETYRNEFNDKAEAFAKERTWKNTAEKLLAEITARLSGESKPQRVGSITLT